MTASLTIPAIVTVTALVAETRIYSVKTCKQRWNHFSKSTTRTIAHTTTLGEKWLRNTSKGRDYLTRRILVYTLTIKNANAPPRSINKQLCTMWLELLKYLFLLRLCQGSSISEEIAVVTVITGVT